jgi:Flp pilus assembly protein TadD
MNDLPGAIESFRKAINLNPDLGEAHATLAQALQKAGHTEEAREELAELQRIDTAKANDGRAMILVETAAGHIKKKSEFAVAINELRQAVTLSPDFTEAHYQLGLALRQSASASSRAGSSQDASAADILAQAETAFRRVLQLNPADALAYLQLGLLLKSRGDSSQAASQFDRAVQLMPGLTEAHLKLGQMAKDAQDWAKAALEFEAVLAWSPEDAEAHYGLAAALQANGQVEEAARELQIALRLKPGFPSSGMAHPR